MRIEPDRRTHSFNRGSPHAHSTERVFVTAANSEVWRGERPRQAETILDHEDLAVRPNEDRVIVVRLHLPALRKRASALDPILNERGTADGRCGTAEQRPV